MCIPPRIDQGLGWVFDTLVALELYQLLWQAPSLFTFSTAPFGRSVPLETPETANPIIIPVGVGSGEGDARRKGCVSFLLCSLEWGTTPLSRDHHPRGPLSLSRAVPRLEGSRLLQHRLPSLQETGLVFVILLALVPSEQQTTFFKTWSKARPLVFPPRKSLGLMGWSCWVPPLLARLWQHGTLPWDTVEATWAPGVITWATPCSSHQFRYPGWLANSSLFLPWKNWH